ncbi:CU044_2847 family protein [Actinomadura bangladeshensis]|uniref:Trypsin-co-occurring domain-containing protein n=1 Tax=Actinomadura bangladeshensis TaxID=453573 RepID=A0A4R4NU20_9ACTN|nr:CU044_2847 family protein [Actinomadura bangladeshensis]TDC12494.1 hypothetical protein E1284_23270 [Actinomadura bangladeshensis]
MEDTPERVPVDLGGATLYIEASELRPGSGGGFGEERDIAAVKPDMTEVIAAIRQFSEQLGTSLSASGATRFAVEFGCEVAMETGKLVAVLGKASAKSTLKVTMEWGQPSP